MHSHLQCQLARQGGILYDTAWSGIYTLYVITAALALLVYPWNCCSHVTIEVSLCWASECTFVAVQSSDTEPEGADRGKACSQSPPAEQVRTELTMQLCSDSLCMHELNCNHTVVCRLACQCIILWSGVCMLSVLLFLLLLYLWNCCSHITIEVSLCCASECTQCCL